MHLSRDEILQRIPHRSPALLLDEMRDLGPGSCGTGVTDLDNRPHVFEGHFPHQPTLPGVLLIECMAQTAALVLAPPPGTEAASAPKYIARIERVTFHRPVLGPELLKTEVTLDRAFGGLFLVAARVMAEGTKVATGKLVLYDPAAAQARSEAEVPG